MRNLLLILLFIPTLAFAQSEDKKHFQVGFGFSFGSFNPTDVNDYIDSRIGGAPIQTPQRAMGFKVRKDYHDGDDPSTGTDTPEIILHLGGKVFMGYRANNNLGIEAFLEGNSAPKMISADNGDDLSFWLNRSVFGAQLSYAIRLGKKHNIILGAGPTYNKISLRDDGHKIACASTVGSKYTVAYQFNYKHIAPRLYLDVDLAKAKDNGIKMDYSGVQFGLAFSGLW